MIKQLSHIVEECPVCGRPVAIRCEHLGHRVVCQHCGGGFVVTEEGARAPEWMPKCERLMEAADRVLQTSAKSLATTAERLAPESCQSSFRKNESDSGWPTAERFTDEALQSYGEPAGDRESLAEPDRVRILLVEQRDEVFARLAADAAEEGFRVVRATTAHEAVEHYAQHPFTLVVANLDLPDQSGWLLAAKLHFVDLTAAVWLYEPALSDMHVAMAKFLRVDELFAYGGDLFSLVDAITARLAERFEGQAARHGRLAEKQKVCPVSGQSLGAMGKPYKVTVNGQEVFLCCQGCEEEIQGNPEKYLAEFPK